MFASMFRDEADVWAYVKPRLAKRGWQWWRIEAAQPTGVPDVHGLCGARGVWIELKEGPVRVSALRRDQRQWIADALRVGAHVWILFGTATGLRWFQDPGLVCEVPAPDFFNERA